MGVDLADGGSAGGEAAGVVVGFEVADEGGGFCAGADEFAKGALEKFSFTRTGAGDEIEDEDTGGFELAAKAAGELVVFLRIPWRSSTMRVVIPSPRLRRFRWNRSRVPYPDGGRIPAHRIGGSGNFAGWQFPRLVRICHSAFGRGEF